ncbi:Hypothetical predicted protein, partial [Olea europaea subsp. europaea]
IPDIRCQVYLIPDEHTHSSGRPEGFVSSPWSLLDLIEFSSGTGRLKAERLVFAATHYKVSVTSQEVVKPQHISMNNNRDSSECEKVALGTCSKPPNVFSIGYTIGPHRGMATGENMVTTSHQLIASEQNNTRRLGYRPAPGVIPIRGP